MSTLLEAHPAPALTAPGEVALQLTGRSHISWSAVSTYQMCPLRYRFRYIEEIPEETIGSSLVFGSAIHSALESHFNELMAGGAVPSHAALLEEFWNAWKCAGEEAAIRFGKGEDASTVNALAARVLAAFQASEAATPDGRLLGVEEPLRGELTPGVPEVLARVDLIVDSGDELLIRDFKTSRSAWSAGKAHDAGEQLLVYSELASELADGRPMRLEFVVLTKTKRPAVETHAVTWDKGRLERTKRVFERVWRAIEQRHFFPAPSPMACGSCPFRAPCGAWRG